MFRVDQRWLRRGIQVYVYSRKLGNWECNWLLLVYHKVKRYIKVFYEEGDIYA